MNNIKILRNFGTIYLWIFVIKVLQVSGNVEYRADTETDRAAIVPALIMNPYAYQIFDDDYTDELLKERNALATPVWRTLNKQHLYYNRLPFIMETTTTRPKNGNSMTSKEINFENLNNFDRYKIEYTNWPKIKQQQHHVKANGNDIKQLRHSLQQLVAIPCSVTRDGGAAADADGNADADDADKHRTSIINIRYKQNGMLPIPFIMGKHFKTKDPRATKKSKTPCNNIKTTVNWGANTGDDVKENLFPPKNDNTLTENDVNDDGISNDNEDRVGIAAYADEENGIANSNGNESLNYIDNNDANTNYMKDQSSDNDHDRDDSHTMNIKHQLIKIISKPHDKRSKPSIGHTPFLPAVSGGAMTNLGKFFRDLSKNVHVSEQYQWNAEEQKLLEGDPNFGDIKHHLTKPNAATDQQTAEWIKAIRFYRPSQKIRSLVAMNPHGQWAHSSQFIDPNYMWVGLGK